MTRSSISILNPMLNSAWLAAIPYETRNLKVESFSVTDEFLLQPDLPTLQLCIDIKESEFGNIFIQAKAKKDMMESALILQKCGFYFVEVTVAPRSNLDKNLVLESFIRDQSSFIPRRYSQHNLAICIVDNDDINTRFSIEKIASESFTDDRFHIDPNCLNSLADIRYVNWVGDLYTNKNVVFYTLELSGENIAFMCRNDDHLILAGFDVNYRNSGLGDYLWLSVMQDMLDKKITQAHTSISLNNTAVLNLYARLGYKFKDTSMNYHYWSS